MPVDGERVINPAMHHINIKTTKLQEMIDWYGLVLGAKVNFQNPIVAFISNDRANHRIALLAVPGLHDDLKNSFTLDFIILLSSTLLLPISCRLMRG
jgi:catechol 2,3-dioxygenase-like lactoylglutathione lyase family enzyme